MRQFLRRFIPISGSAIALWTWHNRDEVLEWAGFGVRAAQKLVAGDTVKLYLSLSRAGPVEVRAPVVPYADLEKALGLSGTVKK